MTSAQPSSRPLLAAGATAVASVGLLVWAIQTGALGPDVGRGADFCEAARAARVRQPVNTWSNLGFVVAGLAVAWRARRPENLGRTLGGRPALATAYACLVVLLGPASAAMHATQSAWGGHLDLLSMYLVASFAATYALARRLRISGAGFGGLFAGLLAGCELVGTVSTEIPVVMFAGNVAFGTLLLLALALELQMVRRGRLHADGRYAVAAGGTMLVAFALWNATNAGLCDPWSPFQGHAVWHVLGAVAAYLLFRYYASERQPAPVTPARARAPR